MIIQVEMYFLNIHAGPANHGEGKIRCPLVRFNLGKFIPHVRISRNGWFWDSCPLKRHPSVDVMDVLPHDVARTRLTWQNTEAVYLLPERPKRCVGATGW